MAQKATSSYTTDSQRKALLKSGKVSMYSFGAKLYLKVSGKGRGSWIYRYQKNGTRRNLGLGSAAEIPLKAARDLASDAAAKAAAGTDIAAERKQARKVAQEVRKLAAEPTFGTLYADHVKEQRPDWNTHHARQWETTWERYIRPVIGDKTARQVTTEDLVEVLDHQCSNPDCPRRQLWKTKYESGRRTRSRIGIVIEEARRRGFFDDNSPNPADYALIERRMPKVPKVVKEGGNHPCLAHKDSPDFWLSLNELKTLEAACLQLIILTACRTSEIREGRWMEIDLDARLWRIPGTRTKTKKPHVIPITDDMVTILNALPRRNEFLFPGTKRGKPINRNAAHLVQKQLNESGKWVDHLIPDDEGRPRPITVHGWRSTFADWAAEETAHPEIVVEKQLGHIVDNKTARKYRRTNLEEKRRILVEDWGRFLKSKMR